MRAIEVHRHLWRQCQTIHQGQYIAYWKSSGQEGCYVASLLDIGAIGQGGIGFSLNNPSIRADVDHDEIRCWHYEGSLYPVADYLYFFELLSMIMTS